jgi:hypothetical protein
MKNRFIISENTTEILNSRVTMNELEALDEIHKQAFLESLRVQSPELFNEYTAWKKSSYKISPDKNVLRKIDEALRIYITEKIKGQNPKIQPPIQYIMDKLSKDPDYDFSQPIGGKEPTVNNGEEEVNKEE